MYFSRVRIRPEIIRSSQLHRVLEANVQGVHRLLWDLFSEQRRTFLYREEIAREQLGCIPHVRGEPVYYVVSKSSPTEPENSLFRVETKGYNLQLEAGQHLSFECRINPVITKNGKKHDVVMDAQLGFLKSLIGAFNISDELPENAKKRGYKNLLLAKGGEALSQHLIDRLVINPLYAGRLEQFSTLSDKLEWAVNAKSDAGLENWLGKQGRRCGFMLAVDENGLSKLQNSAYQWHALPTKRKREKGERAGFSSIDFTGELQIVDVDKFRQALFKGIGRSKAFGCGLLMIRRVSA